MPDFESLTREFYRNIACIQNTIMRWAITYSRLHMPRKTALLKERYKEAGSNSFFYICLRLQ